LRDEIEILTKLKMGKNFHQLENCNYISFLYRKEKQEKPGNYKGIFIHFLESWLVDHEIG
jgi:hypothetical protein